MPVSTQHHLRETAPAGPVDLLLENANVMTLEPAQPRAEAVAVRGQTIVAVGNKADMAHLLGFSSRVIDCQGMTLLPGLVDAHCHLLATAAALQGLDCSPEAVPSIQQLQIRIRKQSDVTPRDRWVRGFGYDELSLREKRHPTRWDLDLASPHHPVRIDHRSGHATVLNSQGLRLARIHRDTPDQVDGVIERDQTTAEPTGLLLEMSGFLRDRLGRLYTDDEFQESISRLDRKLLSYGITSVQDAGSHNDVDRWCTIRSLQSSRRLTCRVNMMAGASSLNDFLAAGLSYGAGDQQLALGHAKMMLTLTTGTLHPDIESLNKTVRDAHGAGFPVALHAVEQEAVAVAARVLRGSAVGNTFRRSVHRDRIEHCAECPPGLMAQVARSRATVVTQPGFVYWNGDRYRERVDPSLLDHLYPVDELLRAGINVAFGSDAPVIDPNPWPAIYSAVTRATKTGEELYRAAPGEPATFQKVSVEEALRMYTVGGAAAEGSQGIKGTIQRGKLADMVLVDQDPTTIEPSELRNIQSALTVLGGSVVWER